MTPDRLPNRLAPADSDPDDGDFAPEPQTPGERVVTMPVVEQADYLDPSRLDAYERGEDGKLVISDGLADMLAANARGRRRR